MNLQEFVTEAKKIKINIAHNAWWALVDAFDHVTGTIGGMDPADIDTEYLEDYINDYGDNENLDQELFDAIDDLSAKITKLITKGDVLVSEDETYGDGSTEGSYVSTTDLFGNEWKLYSKNAAKIAKLDPALTLKK